MSHDLRIAEIHAREILDSRGNPTLRTTVTLAGGAQGTAAVPSGASTGTFEAHEWRDGEPSRYGGKGVLGAVEHVERELADALRGRLASRTEEIDRIMIETDGTENKARLGANAILSVSLATAHAAAAAHGIPLWQYLGGTSRRTLPVPMMNILNGGAHAANNLDVQEFMILPIGTDSFCDALRMGSEITHALGRLLHRLGYTTGVGDEGGFAPDLQSEEEAMELILEAVEIAGYSRDTVRLGLDVAASEWQSGEGYRLPKAGTVLNTEGMIRRWQAWTEKYPIYSIEDGLGEEDFAGWADMTAALSETMLVGDDLFVTNTRRLQTGMRMKAANAILIKPNQIGTLTETVDVIRLAQQSGYRVILSHRSGETEDTTIADLAVALGADFIKAGAPCRSERVAKYNRLLDIESSIRSPLYAATSQAFRLRPDLSVC